jgi:hypothetical protein
MNPLITTQYHNLLCAQFYKQYQIDDTISHLYVNNAMQNLENSIKKNKDSVLKPKKLKTQSKIQAKMETKNETDTKPMTEPKTETNDDFKVKILSLAEKLGYAEAKLEYYTSMLNISEIEVRPYSEYLDCAKETFEAFEDDDNKFHLHNCAKNFKKYQDKVDIAIMGKTFASDLVESLTFSIDLALHSINQKINVNILNKVRRDAKDRTEVEFIEKLKIFKESYKDLYWN